MKPNKYIPISFLLCFVKCVSCWQYFTPLLDLTMSNYKTETKFISSEYHFGGCENEPEKNLKLYAHIHFEPVEVLGKIIMRGWLDIFRLPTCILLRATAWEENALSGTSYNFQICVLRITYCHTHKRAKYHYYEWYIPTDVSGGTNWDIYFYGPWYSQF